MSASEHSEYKKMVVLAIEYTLLQLGMPTLEKVQEKLRAEYNCSLSDCYAHPEYLNKVLKDLFGPAHLEIVKSISKYLEEFTYQKPISEFLLKII